jgi:hypothetical protein
VPFSAISDWNPNAIAAGASCVTAAVALIAALVALQQWRDGRITRREQVQPYVLVFMEVTKASSMYLDLVIKNVGKTIAHDVTFQFDPALVSTFDKIDGTLLRDAPILQTGIRTFPPGTEHRLMFASGPELLESEEIPRRYDVITRFKDTAGEKYKLEYRLDAEIFTGYSSFTLYGEHDAAKSLREIAATTKKWTAHFDGVRVWVRDEDKYNEELRRQMDRREEEHHQRELRQQLHDGLDRDDSADS